MQTRLAALALPEIKLPGRGLHAHTFHHSPLEPSLAPIACGECPNGSKMSEPVYRVGMFTASHVHAYFASNRMR